MKRLRRAGIWWECEKPGRWTAREGALRCLRLFHGLAAEAWEVYVVHDGCDIAIVGEGLTMLDAIDDAAEFAVKELIARKEAQHAQEKASQEA